MEITTSHVPPSYGLDAFNCPTCGAYSRQLWSAVMDKDKRNIGQLLIARCERCTVKDGDTNPNVYSIWYKEKLIYPDAIIAPLPNSDLSSEIIDDYNEASSILLKSPRGAAALLRLCIQKLCVQLGEKGDHLDTDIGNLVKKGLASTIQQSLDIVRVVGNNAVHPGEMNLKDDVATATALFKLINLIADSMITQPKQVQELYNSLPQKALDGINNRAKRP